MSQIYSGRDGRYEIHNPQFILQIKNTGKANVIEKGIIHLTPESIEDPVDKDKIKLWVSYLQYEEILGSIIA